MTVTRSPEITAILAKSSPEFVACYEANEARFLTSAAALVKVSSLCDAFPVDGGWRLRNWYAGTESADTYPTSDAARDRYINGRPTMVRWAS